MSDLAGPLAEFTQLFPGARIPQRADRSAGGMLPTRAFRYCEAVTTASAFGWYVFSPLTFSLTWTGEQIAWTFDGGESWLPLGRAQFPDFSAAFDRGAPDRVRGYAPPFLAALPEPGVVQVWSGLLARTRKDWSLLVRAAANIPRQGSYELFEGLVEPDRWFGPLFTNIRLTRTDLPVTFDADYPLFQVQPVQRTSYTDQRLNDFTCRSGIDAMSTRDWPEFEATVIKPGNPAEQPLGEDAGKVRRRRRAEIPAAE